ncbi:methionine--tRNA ligase [Simkania negevensis]|uniref:Methionine--tRNA ligase n=1 Tax=Simkania negevensis (strain ATCC VR-1471 / DSM 27360 / Z) TaxID=331113 RepID=F8L7C0_SIMNZ|nr:methionine--tRNA ligase [Simkania negevensis]CCB88644.1 methionyl-tRNA synthetase [Simkania negevensis Z]
MSKKVLITAALPYANGPLHFGHIAGAYLPADCYARFQRLVGHDVLYICGSDEHGVPITLNAEMAGRTPQEHVDIFHHVIASFFKQLRISFDHYSRTTWDGHVHPTQQFFLDLLENGYIEPKVTEQLFSPADNRFLADRYVVGICPKCHTENARGDECPTCGASYEATDLKNPRSKLTGAELVLKPTKHWFLRFDLFKDKLTNWIKKKHWKSNVVNFAQNYIDDLKPRAITRDSDWGIPVPLDDAEGKVFYVWFDAPIGYISATMEWAQKVKNDPNAWEKYWLDPDTHYVQFVGKDNIPFHAIFFPAMVMGQNTPYKLVDELPANEFYNLEGKQFSKSTGWYIDLEDFFKKFSPDQIRYAIAANAPESQDSEFSWKDFQMRCNTELLGKYGNLINRVLVFTLKHFEGEIPSFGKMAYEDEKFLEEIEEKAKAIYQSYSHFQLRKASQLIMELATLGNTYFDAKKPWIAAKDPKLRGELGTTLACSLRILNVLALVSAPIIPETAEKLWKLLGYEKLLSTYHWQDVLEQGLPKTHTLKTPEVLFQKVEDEMIAAEIEALKKRAELSAPKPQKEIPPFKQLLDFEYFQQLDLRVGQILSVEPVPKSKKLLKLEVDFGIEKRTIVSGIAKGFPDTSVLIGKKATFVVNLKPVKLMGVESQGMLLVNGEAPRMELLELSNGFPGETVS